MNKLSGLLLALFLLLPAPAAAEGLSVAVSIPPQEYFARAICGERLEALTVMVPPGAEPHAYEPSPRQVGSLSEADVYFAVGAPFERAWLERFGSISPAMRVVHTDSGIDKIPMGESGHEGHGHEAHGHEEHGHGEHGHGEHGHGEHGHGEHGHGEHGHAEHGNDAHAHESHGHGEPGREAHGHGAYDPHVWLAPEPVRVIADNMLAALVEADPAGAEAYRAGHARLLEEVARTDREVRNILADVPRGAAFLVYHPAFAYFARAYGLREVAIQQAGKEPSPRRLAELTEMAREKGVEAIFVEPQFSTREASIIADRIGAEVVEADPLAADWPDNLKRLARAFRSAAK